MPSESLARPAPATSEPLEPRTLLNHSSFGLFVNGLVFDDRDGDGRRDRGEPGIPAVTITDAGEPTGVTTTDNEGRFQWFRMGVAFVSLQAVPPPGMHVTAGDDGVRTAENPGGRNRTVRARPIPLTRTGGVTGTVFYDADEDGVRSPDAVGVPGRRLFLDRNNDFSRQRDEPVARTDVRGNFFFRGVAPGTYHVVFDDECSAFPAIRTCRWKVNTEGEPSRQVVLVRTDGALVTDVLFGITWTGRGTPRLGIP
jgi:hypothetical protein